MFIPAPSPPGTMTTNEVAEAAGCWTSQVTRYARILGVEPLERGHFRTIWPDTLPEAIRAHQQAALAKQGPACDEFWVREGFLHIGRRVKPDKRRRTVARVKLTASIRRKLAAALDQSLSVRR